MFSTSGLESSSHRLSLTFVWIDTPMLCRGGGVGSVQRLVTGGTVVVGVVIGVEGRVVGGLGVELEPQPRRASTGMIPSGTRKRVVLFMRLFALADQDEPEPRESEPRGSRVADPPVLESVDLSTGLSVHGDGDGPADEVAEVVDELHGDHERPAAAVRGRCVVEALGHAQAPPGRDAVRAHLGRDAGSGQAQPPGGIGQGPGVRIAQGRVDEAHRPPGAGGGDRHDPVGAKRGLRVAGLGSRHGIWAHREGEGGDHRSGRGGGFDRARGRAARERAEQKGESDESDVAHGNPHAFRNGPESQYTNLPATATPEKLAPGLSGLRMRSAWPLAPSRTITRPAVLTKIRPFASAMFPCMNPTATGGQRSWPVAGSRAKSWPLSPTAYSMPPGPWPGS